MSNQIRTLDTLKMVGETLCLDFVNTINSRHTLEHDYLATYHDLIAWSLKAGSISPNQAQHLTTMADGDATAATQTLLEAHQLRELIYRVFSSLADGRTTSNEDLRALSQVYGEAFKQAHFQWLGDHYNLEWQDVDNLNFPLWPVAHSAGVLLFSDKLARVKECPGCGWLFLDVSKNHTRRWCSMEMCGARDKMHRYRQRNL